MKFCPRCGKKGIAGDFCSVCSAEMLGSILEFKEISIKICPSCMTYFFQNKQTRFDDLAVVVKKVAKENIKKRIYADIRPILPHIEFKPGKEYSFEVEVVFSPKEKYYLPARIEMARCRKCDKGGTQYFEGVLQLRNPNKEAVEFIRKDIERQKGRSIFITNEKKAGSGIDFYISSQRYLQTLGLKLQKQFGGLLKINPRLFSRDRQTSKDIHRVNVYFELLGFKTGDVVRCDDKLIKISSTGKQIAGVNMVTGKRTSFACRNEAEALERKKAEVVKVYPQIEVLDPDTYQAVKVENKKKVNVGDKVSIINDKGRFYIV